MRGAGIAFFLSNSWLPRLVTTVSLAAGNIVEWLRRDVLPWFLLPVGAVAKFASYEEEQQYEGLLQRA